MHSEVNPEIVVSKLSHYFWNFPNFSTELPHFKKPLFPNTFGQLVTCQKVRTFCATGVVFEKLPSLRYP